VSAPALSARQLTKRYPDGSARRTVVDSIELSIEPGELVVLAGPSGSGKTTLLGMLGGMIAPTSGDVLVHGESIVHLRDRHRTELRRRHVGFVFQELSLLSDRTVLDNVLLPLIPTGRPTLADRARAEARLRSFGLGARMGAMARELSGGERQRAAWARALIRDPRIVLLDEPTAHLDAASVDTLLATLSELVHEGRAIVCTTHDPRLLQHGSVSRVLTMQDGHLRS
jgi:putative ABC transport system ATP-binding protein